MAIIFEGIQSPVLMESEPGFSLFVLTHFLRANRHPLRSKTPQTPGLDPALQEGFRKSQSGSRLGVRQAAE